MNQAIEYIIENFRPEFGNINHIRACELIKKIREKEKNISPLDKYDDDKKIMQEVRRDEKQLLFLLKQKL